MTFKRAAFGRSLRLRENAPWSFQCHKWLAGVLLLYPDTKLRQGTALLVWMDHSSRDPQAGLPNPQTYSSKP